MYPMACGATRPGPASVVGRPRAWWHHVPSGTFANTLFSAFFFFDWGTHFVVFSGGVEQGLGGPTAQSWKVRRNGSWEPWRLYLAGAFAPPPPCCYYRSFVMNIISLLEAQYLILRNLFLILISKPVPLTPEAARSLQILIRLCVMLLRAI